MKRKKTLVSLTAALLGAAALFAAAKPGTLSSRSAEGAELGTFIDSPEAIEAAAASTVKIDAYDKDGIRIATGSGFVAGDPAVVVTASHVVVNMKEAEATTDAGDTFTLGRVLYANTDTDVAVFELPEGTGLVPLPCREDFPKRGEKAAAIGSQFGCVNLVTMGNVCGMWGSGPSERILFTCPVSSGNSGGPVFDREGRVIGLVSGTYDRGQNMNLAVPIGKVTVVLERMSGDGEP